MIRVLIFFFIFCFGIDARYGAKLKSMANLERGGNKSKNIQKPFKACNAVERKFPFYDFFFFLGRSSSTLCIE